MANRTLARGDRLGQTTFAISRRTFEQLEDWMQDNQASIQKANEGMRVLTRLCILVVKAEVQKRSFGPVAPGQRSVPSLAFKIPVQRITGRYFAGWTVRPTRGGWKIYNDEIEAYLIETGMYQRTRRPILKMSVLDMVSFIQGTRTEQRFLEYVFAPRRSANGRFRSFENRTRSLALALAAPDMPDRGAGNANIIGPKGRLPK